MRYSTPLFGLVGAAAGLVVATTGYQLAAAPVASGPRTSEPLAAVGRPLPVAPAEVRTRFAPCTPPAKLHHGVCVTHQWRTTVVYDVPAAPASAPHTPTQGAAGPAPVRAADPVSQPDAEEESYEQEQEVEHAGEDDGHEEDHEAEDPGDHDEPEDD